MSTPDQFGIYTTDQLDECVEFFDTHGFAVLRGLVPDAALATIEAECVAA
jgi:uncharacterized membrane protein